MIDLALIMNLHRVLNREPDATDQATTLMMLNITFALHAAGFDISRARKILIELHKKALETLAVFEQDEKRPLN